MPTGHLTQMTGNQPQGFVSIFGEILFRGDRKSKQLFLGLAQKRNTVH